MKKFLSKVREYIPLFTIVVFFLTIISLVLYIIILNNVSFADYFNYNLSFPTRVAMSWLTAIIPFSVAEIVLLASPLILFVLIMLSVKYGKRGKKASIKYLMVIVSIICLIFVLYVWTYSSGFHTTKIEDKMNLDRGNLTKDELYEASQIIVAELNNLAEYIEYDENGASTMSYSYSEMSKKICKAYESFVKKYPVLRTYFSKIKPIILSEPMTYTHISGIYTFMSGEANVNVNYPDFVIASTSAHEMAHQRGFAREDECNFISFAVLLESDDPFLRYSAYLDVYANVVNALYNESPELYYEIATQLDKRVVADRHSYSIFFEKYADSKASEIADSMNDSYLQANGQTEGTRSYGMIVEIVTAYLINKTK